MATPGSGTISISDVSAEFQNGNALGNYYRGIGTMSTIDNTLSAITTSSTGPRNLAQFYGKSRTEYVTTYGWITWALCCYDINDTYYGEVQIYRGGKIRLHQQVWCGHYNYWWGDTWSNIGMYNTITLSRSPIVSGAPSMLLWHDGGSLILSDPGRSTYYAATGAPLSW